MLPGPNAPALLYDQICHSFVYIFCNWLRRNTCARLGKFAIAELVHIASCGRATASLFSSIEIRTVLCFLAGRNFELKKQCSRTGPAALELHVRPSGFVRTKNFSTSPEFFHRSTVKYTSFLLSSPFLSVLRLMTLF